MDREAKFVTDHDSNWCWWSPKQDSICVSFCSESTLHGLQYIGQRKRHMTERIFWAIAFLLSLAAAIYLIYGIWDGNRRVPVIVSFQAKKQNINSIPFPAVTLCNINQFPKSKILELNRIAKDPSNPRYNEARLKLTFVRSVCNARHSFAKKFHYAANRGPKSHGVVNDTFYDENQDEMMDFFLGNTLSCDELIRLCTFGENIVPCGELFRPVMTDYGKCCTFNILPLPLLLRNHKNEGKKSASLFENPALGTIRNWNQSELHEWQKWNYEEGFVLPKKLKRPYRQKRAGIPYGLSLLVDPNADDYYCPAMDSTGVRFILHTPLEMPHVREFASVADLEKEILIEVHPDMTTAHDDIGKFERKKRQCIFGKEKKLHYFRPYTGGNCMDECTAHVLGKTCKCDESVRTCNNDLDSDDHSCIRKARHKLQDTLKKTCGHCDPLCKDIAYNYETTTVQLQDAMKLWGDPDMEHLTEIPKWASHKMSVPSLQSDKAGYQETTIEAGCGGRNKETTVPKLRKRLHGDAALIANTGGILGLCLGFSVLSAAEVLYFITLRAFCNFCRRRRVGVRIANRFARLFKPRPEKVIHIKPNMIPVYPGYYR